MMNTLDLFWQQCRREKGIETKTYIEAFHFGVEADWLAGLVRTGKKRATCSGHIFYELENEPLPQAEEYNIVLYSSNEPAAVIRTTRVDVLPMNEVPKEFAEAEGEGDYDAWWHNHEVFFRDHLKASHLTFSPDMLLVCERFEVVYSN